MTIRAWVSPVRSFFFPAAIVLGAISVGCGDSGATGGGGSSSSSTTSATSTSATGTGGGGGANTGPIVAPENQWTWVDFPDSRCMTDTPTGIAVNFTSASNDVLIFMEGGNACFNAISCAITANKNGLDANSFATNELPGLADQALFQRVAANPVKDYNYVYIPYCTGDVHAGDAQNVMVAGKARNFHGYKNVTEYLKRIVPTFPTPGKVILTGQSAGGFGAAYDYDQVARAYPNVKVTLLDDSGPPMAVQFVPQCLQKFFSDTWGLSKTAPPGCPNCAPADGAFMEPLVAYITTAYADRNLALVSSTEDATISQFWGYGNNDCADLAGAPPPYDPALYTGGLADLRDRIAGPDANFFTYYIDGTDGSDKTRHVWTDDPTGVSSNGVLLTDWIAQLVNDDPALTDVPPKM